MDICDDGLPDEAAAVLDFWYRALAPEQWFKKDDAVDAAIRERFGSLYDRVRSEDYTPLQPWLETARGTLAAIILLDQFPRNMFRDSPRAFESDPTALKLAEQAIEAGFDLLISETERCFFYVPMEHAEDLSVQERCCDLMHRTGDPEYVRYAIAHRDIIARFGRFPHRNKALGRATTAAEAEFLTQPGSSF